MHHGTTRSWEAGIPLPLGLCVGIRQRDRFRIIRGQQSETLSKNQPCRSADHFEILKQMPICIDALLCLNLVVNFLCRNAGTRVASGQQGLGHPKVSAGPWSSQGVRLMDPRRRGREAQMAQQEHTERIKGRYPQQQTPGFRVSGAGRCLRRSHGPGGLSVFFRSRAQKGSVYQTLLWTYTCTIFRGPGK